MGMRIPSGGVRREDSCRQEMFGSYVRRRLCASISSVDGIDGCDPVTWPVDDDMAAHDDVLPPATVQDRHSLGKPK